MSATHISEQAALPKLASLSLPLRNTFLTILLTVSTLALSGFLWREQGYEMLIVTMGWPHVLLGFIFYFGRVMRGEQSARSAFLLLALLTLILWTIHYQFVITGLIYLYFLYHAFRDEIFVFLQTRAGHQAGGPRVFAIAGIGPLILLLLLVPKQQDFRQDLRRVELTGAQVPAANWTLISFKPVANSAGRDFYFQLQAPHTEGLRAFVTQATVADTRPDGDILIGDQKWPEARDLRFRPHYLAELTANQIPAPTTPEIPVLLTGGHKVGQTFRAEQNNLDGIWLPINRLEQPGESTQFVFHLASPPLLPYSPLLSTIRLVLLIALSVVVLYRLIPRDGKGSQLWIYLLVLAIAFAGTQMILKRASNAGFPFPLIFQFVVVFHYWSWYVFSFDKLRTMQRQLLTPASGPGTYDRLLNYLRQAPYFTATVIGLNVLSGAGVLWYYKLNGPSSLRFAFDYSYFLYFLVLHVTFSFSPKPRVIATRATPAQA